MKKKLLSEIKEKLVNYDKIITQDMIMPYVTDWHVEKPNPELYDITFEVMQNHILANNVDPNEIFQTINLLKFSWVKCALENKLRHDDESSKEDLR